MITANYIRSNLAIVQSTDGIFVIFKSGITELFRFVKFTIFRVKECAVHLKVKQSEIFFLTLPAYCFNEKYYKLIISFVNLTKIYNDWAMLFSTAIADLSTLDITMFASVFMFSLAQTNVHLNKKTYKDAHAQYVNIVHQLYVRTQMPISCCPVC